MTKGSILNPQIKIKPTVKLCNYIATTLKDVKEIPENILNIYKLFSKDDQHHLNKTICTPEVTRSINFTQDEKEFLWQMYKEDIDAKNKDQTNEESYPIVVHSNSDNDTDEDEEDNDDGEDGNIDVDNIDNNDGEPLKISKTQKKLLKEKQKQKLYSKLYLNLNDLKWLDEYLMNLRQQTDDDNDNHNQNSDCLTYLHELLEGSKLILPKNQKIKRDPALEERCTRLRFEQEALQYQKMTKNVDPVRRQLPEDTIAYQLTQINRQLIAVLQFVFSIVAGFAFGFIGIELIVGDLDFGFRLLLGIMIALIVALAEIYFLAKKLNEEYDISVEKPKVIVSTNNSSNSAEASSIKDNKKEHIE